MVLNKEKEYPKIRDKKDLINRCIFVKKNIDSLWRLMHRLDTALDNDPKYKDTICAISLREAKSHISKAEFKIAEGLRSERLVEERKDRKLGVMERGF